MSLRLPDGVRKQAFRAFVSIIQGDPLLSGVVQSWRVWDGTSLNPIPSVEQMPCVGLRLLGGSIERLSTNDEGEGCIPTVDLRTRPTVVVETWVAGTDASDSYDLYDAIDCVLFPQDQIARRAIRDALLDVGISDLMPVKDVLPETLADYSSTSIHAIGTYILTLDVTQ